EAAGIDVWFDRDLVVGEEWSEIIEAKITGCDVFVPVMSGRSGPSQVERLAGRPVGHRLVGGLRAVDRSDRVGAMAGLAVLATVFGGRAQCGVRDRAPARSAGHAGGQVPISPDVVGRLAAVPVLGRAECRNVLPRRLRRLRSGGRENRGSPISV